MARAVVPAYELNAMADTGKYDIITPRSVLQYVNNRSIRQYILEMFAPDIYLSLLSNSDWDEITEHWYNLANVADSRRKFGVKNTGLCLLSAYALETLQRACSKPGEV